MSTDISNSDTNASGKLSPTEEQQAKIKEVRKSLGELPENSAIYCSDASISRYLTARNWNIKKATKMLKDTLKWRIEYKPEEIRWDEIAHEAETGKIYRSDYVDKFGRTVLVMRPSCQNTRSTKGQIRYLVYCMENAILNLPPDQEQMVWLIDFQGFNLSHISVKVTRETAHVLQDQYPERLGLAILYNPPKFFEPFWNVVKPFLEPKTYRKVKFVYSDDPSTKKITEDLFDMEKLESTFGGLNQEGFNYNNYAERMREDDKKMPLFWMKGNPQTSAVPPPCLNSGHSASETDNSDKEPADHASPDEVSPSPRKHFSKDGTPEANGSRRAGEDIESAAVSISHEPRSNDEATRSGDK